MIITSLDNNKIKKYIKLKQKKYRDEDKLFIVEGEHLVEEAIKNNLLYDLLVIENYEYKIDFPYTVVSNNIMKKLSDMESIPKIIGIVKQKEENNNLGNKILIIDDVQDPGNLGTIIRSAVAFNVSDIILNTGCVDLYNDKVIRSSQGMIFNVNIIRRNIKEEINNLKNKGYIILGTNVKNGCDVSTLIINKYALVIGNEGNGVKKEIQDICDKNIYIEMNKECESLNVGVATSIILYELNR